MNLKPGLVRGQREADRRKLLGCLPDMRGCQHAILHVNSDKRSGADQSERIVAVVDVQTQDRYEVVLKADPNLLQQSLWNVLERQKGHRRGRMTSRYRSRLSRS